MNSIFFIFPWVKRLAATSGSKLFSLCRIHDTVQQGCAVWHIKLFEQFDHFLFLRKNDLPFIFCLVDEGKPREAASGKS